MEQQFMERLTKSIEKLGDKFDDFGERLTRIEARFETFDRTQNNLANKVDDVENIARESMQSTKAAHNRLDEISGELSKIPTISQNTSRLDKLEKVVWWAGTTLILTMVGVIGYLVKQGG